jgi:hypothetical protein
MVGDTAPALPPLNIHAKPASDAVRKARRELFMAKHYRAVAVDSAFATWLSKQVMRIDYKNYKDRMELSRGHDFAGALLGVWSTMRQVEDADARS